ncbi:nitroreductase family deazaflavin-dependent oxidoreductase [Pseudofrankia sp. DC12]|uniref:nitroreductase family deazaflavin-dependent oxidoreductase n=1 Tax=Pseudofrankia sp. DC12 TaxID=683315 RepID=UPI0005F771A7|nr:nitroreductase family deazaflavin-dependent oxidoreductase [Pseudofrankia sp. DC12]
MTSSTTPTDSPNAWVADHTRKYLESGGEEGHLWHGPDGKLAEGVPTLLLTTIGRRSGQPRRTALIYGQDGDDYLVIASKGGAAAHPLWYENLLANPDVTLQVRSDSFDATAHTATPEEKARLWPVMAKVWPPYDDYQKKTDREIPVVILTRKS